MIREIIMQSIRLLREADGPFDFFFCLCLLMALFGSWITVAVWGIIGTLRIFGLFGGYS
jgi:hypothetical protein